MAHTIIDSMKMRRSIYHIGNELPISKSEVETLVKEAVQYAPSAFNSQTARAIILFGKENDWLWDLVWQKLQPLLAKGQEQATR